MFRAIFCPSSGAWDWDFYSIWYPAVVVARETVSGSSISLCSSVIFSIPFFLMTYIYLMACCLYCVYWTLEIFNTSSPVGRNHSVLVRRTAVMGVSQWRLGVWPIFIFNETKIVKHSVCWQRPSRISYFDILFAQKQSATVIQMNQLDATMVYWSIRSAQHVSGNILSIIRSVRQIFTAYGILLSWAGRRWAAAWDAAAHRLPTHHHNRIPYAVNISVSRSWWWTKYCPKHVELIL